MKQRYFIELSYNGTNFHGWQIQPNAVTIQEELNKALSTLLREDIETVGAGRTDSGVHAKFFVAHFDSDNLNIDANNVIHRLNKFLSNDIAINKIYKVVNTAHSRFDALSRTYKYYICKNKDPFNKDFCYYFPLKLDIEKINKACKILFKYTDFSCFSKLHTDTKTNNCKITVAECVENNKMIVFTITADRFLRNMVRAIVGTLIEVGQNKINLNDFSKIIESKNRSNAGKSVPAKGLFLENIKY